MSDRLENRKIFLIAFSSAEHRERIDRALQHHVPGCTIFHSVDGAEAWMKMVNMPPHVIVLERGLAKVDGLQLTSNVLASRKLDGTSVIFFGPPPETESFVDDIVTGRIQFLATPVDDDRFARSVARALNDASSREDTSFHMRFLAPGDRLLREGERSRNVYLVRRGRLKACHQAGSSEVVLGEIETGEFVGEMAYINDEPRSADVLALTDCELIEIPAEHLDHELYRKPSWAKALMVTLSKRIKKANLKQTDPATE